MIVEKVGVNYGDNYYTNLYEIIKITIVHGKHYMVDMGGKWR